MREHAGIPEKMALRKYGMWNKKMREGDPPAYILKVAL